jgi:hypothetical protein
MGVIRGGSIVRVAASFMPRLAVSLLSVLMAKFVVRIVLDRQRSLTGDSVAHLIVVKSQPKCGETMSPEDRICHSCKSLRVKQVRPPRELIKLPIEVTQDSIFNNRGIPIFLCEFCDAQELQAALEAHEKRIDNK